MAMHLSNFLRIALWTLSLRVYTRLSLFLNFRVPQHAISCHLHFRLPVFLLRVLLILFGAPCCNIILALWLNGGELYLTSIYNCLYSFSRYIVVLPIISGSPFAALVFLWGGPLRAALIKYLRAASLGFLALLFRAPGTCALSAEAVLSLPCRALGTFTLSAGKTSSEFSPACVSAEHCLLLVQCVGVRSVRRRPLLPRPCRSLSEGRTPFLWEPATTAEIASVPRLGCAAAGGSVEPGARGRRMGRQYAAVREDNDPILHRSCSQGAPQRRAETPGPGAVEGVTHVRLWKHHCLALRLVAVPSFFPAVFQNVLGVPPPKK